MTLKTLRVRPQEHKNVTEEVKIPKPSNRQFQAQGNYAQTPAVWKDYGHKWKIKRINRAFCHPAHDYSAHHQAFVVQFFHPLSHNDRCHPVTDQLVSARASDIKRSIPVMSARPATGRCPTAEIVAASTIKPLPVTPAAPFEESSSTTNRVI